MLIASKARTENEFGERGSDMKKLVRYRFYIPFAAMQAER